MGKGGCRVGGLVGGVGMSEGEGEAGGTKRNETETKQDRNETEKVRWVGG